MTLLLGQRGWIILDQFLIISEFFHVFYTLLYLAFFSFLLLMLMSQWGQRQIYARSRKGSLWNTTVFIKYLWGAMCRRGRAIHPMAPSAAVSYCQGGRFGLHREMNSWMSSSSQLPKNKNGCLPSSGFLWLGLYRQVRGAFGGMLYQDWRTMDWLAVLGPF